MVLIAPVCKVWSVWIVSAFMSSKELRSVHDFELRLSSQSLQLWL